MARFSSTLKGVLKVKNHGAAKGAKIEIRDTVLSEVGAQAVVFDGFAGTGEMYAAVWHKAAGYVGCDKDWARDLRVAYVADNRRVLRAISLERFSIFDLDAFGSPWEQAIIIAARRRVADGEKIGIILTDGSSLALRQGGLPNALAELTGLSKRMPGLARWQDDVIDQAIAGLCRRMSVVVERRWQAQGHTRASVRYIGLVLAGHHLVTPPVQ